MCVNSEYFISHSSIRFFRSAVKIFYKHNFFNNVLKKTNIFLIFLYINTYFITILITEKKLELFIYIFFLNLSNTFQFPLYLYIFPIYSFWESNPLTPHLQSHYHCITTALLIYICKAFKRHIIIYNIILIISCY